MFPIQDVSPIEIAFPADVEHLLPSEDAEVTSEARRRWGRLFDGLFTGTVNATKVMFLPRIGVAPKKAWDHFLVVLGTYSIKHERKVEACIYMLDQWFNGWGYSADEHTEWMKALRKECNRELNFDLDQDETFAGIVSVENSEDEEIH